MALQPPSEAPRNPAILFICTANQCRSPIAAAIFSAAQDELTPATRYQVNSAGTWTRSGISIQPPVLRLAKKVGVDLAGFHTTSVEDVPLDNYTWIVTAERGHQEALALEHPELRDRIVLLTTLAGLTPSDIPDPMSTDPQTALGILMDMQDCVRRIAHRLLTDAP